MGAPRGDLSFHFTLFDLAPGGVYLAGSVTRPAGELLPHRFTLTLCKQRAVYFLLHYPWPHDRWALPITVSLGARTFLPPNSLLLSSTLADVAPAIARPATLAPGEFSQRDPSHVRNDFLQKTSFEKNA